MIWELLPSSSIPLCKEILCWIHSYTPNRCINKSLQNVLINSSSYKPTQKVLINFDSHRQTNNIIISVNETHIYETAFPFHGFWQESIVLNTNTGILELEAYGMILHWKLGPKEKFLWVKKRKASLNYNLNKVKLGIRKMGNVKVSKLSIRDQLELGTIFSTSIFSTFSLHPKPCY